MRKTDELRGPSCLTSAADDEPIFVLRANDELAPDVVRVWADWYVRAKGPAITPKQIAKLEEARQLAELMETWKRAAVGKSEVQK